MREFLVVGNQCAEAESQIICTRAASAAPDGLEEHVGALILKLSHSNLRASPVRCRSNNRTVHFASERPVNPGSHM